MDDDKLKRLEQFRKRKETVTEIEAKALALAKTAYYKQTIRLEAGTELTSASSLKTQPIRDWVTLQVIGGLWSEPVKKQAQIENLTDLVVRLLTYLANKEPDPVRFISEFLGQSFYIIKEE